MVVVLLPQTAKREPVDRSWHLVELVYFGPRLSGRKDLRVYRGRLV